PVLVPFAKGGKPLPLKRESERDLIKERGIKGERFAKLERGNHDTNLKH
ncbi:unnamed protein product, partial [marine sediment metagenome]